MRRAALLVCAMVTALVVATGVALAAAEEKTRGNDAIGKVPLRDDEPSKDYVPGEVVVRKENGEYETRKVDAHTLTAVEKAAENIEKTDRSVDVASPNFVYRLAGYDTNDPYYYYQDWLSAIKAPGAWNYGKGSGVRIGVVDSGLLEDHPDLVGKVDAQYDFLDEDEWAEAEGNGYHGTAVAGVAAAATNNNEGVASAGFNARVVVAEACTENPFWCETEDTAPAIDWLVEQNVKIINLSFAGPPTDPVADENLREAIERAQAAGALVVAAAGQGGVDTGVQPYYPACFPGVLGVGAVYPDGTKWAPSNYGDCVDLVAPGVRVLTTVNWGENSPYPPYGYVTGTSFSAPQVAGTAALIKAKNPGLSADKIAERLTKGSGLLNAKCSVEPAAASC